MPPEAEENVVVDGLTVAYGPAVVLDRIDLRVRSGSALAVVGANGTGKSTLLRCVAGLQEPTSGLVRVFGDGPGRGLDFWRNVATTVEAPTWYHGLTVREHLELVRLANGEDPSDGEVEEICAALGLAGLDGHLPGTLSSGQRQRFLLTAVLVRPSRLLVLDEPEQHLDAESIGVVAAHLRAYVADGRTLLIATHSQELVAGAGAATFDLGRGR